MRRPSGGGPDPQADPGASRGGASVSVLRQTTSPSHRPVTLVLNPSSGSGSCQDEVRRAAARIPHVDVCEVEPSRDAGALAREAVRDGAQVLVSCGGDGTVSAVAAVAV